MQGSRKSVTQMAFLPKTTLNSIKVFVPSFLLAILLYLGKSLTMNTLNSLNKKKTGKMEKIECDTLIVNSGSW